MPHRPVAMQFFEREAELHYWALERPPKLPTVPAIGPRPPVAKHWCVNASPWEVRKGAARERERPCQVSQHTLKRQRERNVHPARPYYD